MDKKKISDYLIKKIDYSNQDEEILKAIEQTILEMEVARSAFQNACDDKLIESLIYKIISFFNSSIFSYWSKSNHFAVLYLLNHVI